MRKKRSPIGTIRKGAFKRWLGKSQNAEVTEADIARGKRSKDPHVRRMANFAANSRKWHHGKRK